MITNTAGCTDARVLSFVTSKLTPSLSLKDSWHFLKQLQLVNDEPILIWRQEWSCNYAPYPFRDTITVCVIFNQTRDYKGPGLWSYMGISWQRKEKNSEWREPVSPRLALLRHTSTPHLESATNIGTHQRRHMWLLSRKELHYRLTFKSVFKISVWMNWF